MNEHKPQPVALFIGIAIGIVFFALGLAVWVEGQGIPLRVQLRSEAGAGPLDVLTLRHFALPTRIFVTASAKALQKQASLNLSVGVSPNAPRALPAGRGTSFGASPKGTSFGASSSPPPLPPAAIAAAKHAATPLPHAPKEVPLGDGALPEVE